jgi:arginyl-tRNA synthetase
MLSFDGNTAPYLQYAHARICSIFRRASTENGIDRAAARATVPGLREPQELALAQRVLGFPAVVTETAERSSPHRLCTYLYELASDFTAFYEHCPVLKAPDAGTRASRLALCDVTARVLASGLRLLGITAPDQM